MLYYHPMKNLVKIPPLLVLALYLSPILLSMGNLSRYFSNLDYIQNELCENREKPELKCAGTCVLAKMIEETQSHEKEKSLLQNQEIPLLIGFNDHRSYLSEAETPTKKSSFSKIYNFYKLILAGSTLDPPDLLV